MKRSYVRRPSANELMFIDMAKLGNDVNEYFLLELDCKPPLEILNQALDTLMKTHSSINLCYRKGRWYPSTVTPHIEAVSVPEDKKVTECMIVPSDPFSHTFSATLFEEANGKCTLCFNVFHGAADGRSVIQLIYDFIAVLNHRAPTDGDFHRNDRTIVGQYPVRYTKIPVKPRCIADGWTPGECGAFAIDRIQVPTATGSIAARLSAAATSMFRPDCRLVMLPVDLRRYDHKPHKFLYGNLILPIYLQAGQDVDTIANEIRYRVQRREALSVSTSFLWGYGLLPDRMRQQIVKQLLIKLWKVPEFQVCAVISNVGRIDTARLENPYFRIQNVSASLGCSYYSGFNVVSTVFGDHTTVSFTWQEGKVPPEAVERFRQELIQKLQ